MIKNRNETSAAMDKALKNLEQAKARYEAERKRRMRNAGKHRTIINI
ncbi:MAG: hypothetical protein ACLRIQ_20585 [Blautia wexlerae]